jgi:hypothetical protein
MHGGFEPEVFVEKIPTDRYVVHARIGPRRATINASGNGHNLCDEACRYELVIELEHTKTDGWRLMPPKDGDWLTSRSKLMFDQGTATVTRLLVDLDSLEEVLRRLTYVPPPVDENAVEPPRRGRRARRPRGT